MDQREHVKKIRGRGKVILTFLIITLVLFLGVVGCGAYFFINGDLSLSSLTSGGEDYLAQAEEENILIGLGDIYAVENAAGIDYLMDVEFDTVAIKSIEVDDSRVDTTSAGSYSVVYTINPIGKEPVEVKKTVEVVTESEVPGLADQGKVVQTGGGQTAGGLRQFNIIPDGLFFARQEDETTTVSDLFDVPVFEKAFILGKNLYFIGDIGGVDASLSVGSKGHRSWKIPLSAACEIYQLNNILGETTQYTKEEFNGLWRPAGKGGCGGTLSITVTGGEVISLIGPMFE